jgi:hypothetical protein
MHDSMACEDRGLPAVFLCTEPFMNAARDHAEACGNPDYQAVQVRYPRVHYVILTSRHLGDSTVVG